MQVSRKQPQGKLPQYLDAASSSLPSALSCGNPSPAGWGWRNTCRYMSKNKQCALWSRVGPLHKGMRHSQWATAEGQRTRHLRLGSCQLLAHLKGRKPFTHSPLPCSHCNERHLVEHKSGPTKGALVHDPMTQVLQALKAPHNVEARNRRSSLPAKALHEVWNESR